MEFNERTRARLYAVTCLACIVWLIQSLCESNADGSLASWATIVFSLCLGVVIAWTGWNAFTGWNAADEKQEEDATKNRR